MVMKVKIHQFDTETTPWLLLNITKSLGKQCNTLVINYQ